MREAVPCDLLARAGALSADDTPAVCPRCGAKDVARAGTWRLKAEVHQLFRCKGLMHKIHGSITGHLDILQFNYGKVWILDFKPGAAREDPEKVITQLSLYATALHYRAKLNIQEIFCAYFDENALYEFRPELL